MFGEVYVWNLFGGIYSFVCLVLLSSGVGILRLVVSGGEIRG